MARNEEKQLARLNRFYLQQHKEEELKKRPPRPRLETLSTLDNVKKWIPSILKDIEFYVTQMEVSCYPKKTVEEFEKRISQLRGEYKAFVRKAHELEPDLSATPWSDRPYSRKRRKLNEDETKESTSSASEVASSNSHSHDSDSESFVPLSTPLLLQATSCPKFYGSRKSDHPAQSDLDMDSQNQPLDFNFSSSKGTGHSILPNSTPSKRKDSSSSDSKLVACESHEKNHSSNSEFTATLSATGPLQGNTTFHEYPKNQVLNIPYSDSSSDEDT